MKDTILNRILNAIHVIFFTSILCFGITFLTGTLLMLPAFTAAFMIGKQLIYKEFDITDSVIKTYFRYIKKTLHLVKYDLLSIIFLLNMGTFIVTGVQGISTYTIICLCIAALILTTMIYIAAYYTFFNEKFEITEVLICMLYKPGFFLGIFAGFVLLLFFFNSVILTFCIFLGSIVLFLIEVVTFLHILYYRKLQGMLEGEKYAGLVMSKEEKEKLAK